MKQYFCVGTYTESILFGTGERFQGKGKGVLICSLEDGEVTVISTIKVRNPSYLCLDEAGRKIYAVNEMKEYMGGFGGGVTQLLSANTHSTIKNEWTKMQGQQVNILVVLAFMCNVCHGCKRGRT